MKFDTLNKRMFEMHSKMFGEAFYYMEPSKLTDSIYNRLNSIELHWSAIKT